MVVPSEKEPPKCLHDRPRFYTIIIKNVVQKNRKKIVKNRKKSKKKIGRGLRTRFWACRPGIF